MNIIVNNYKTNEFKGVQKVYKYTDEEKTHILTQSTINEMQKRAEFEVPEYGHFRRIEQIFDIPGSTNEAFFAIQHNTTAPKDKRSLYIGVRKPRIDKEISNLIADGDKKDVINSIKKLDAKEVAENIKRLSAKVDIM